MILMVRPKGELMRGEMAIVDSCDHCSPKQTRRCLLFTSERREVTAKYHAPQNGLAKIRIYVSSVSRSGVFLDN